MKTSSLKSPLYDSCPETTDTFASYDGTRIFYRHYPANPERARLVISPGLCEHSGRYRNLVQYLVPMGISIWVIDHRGNGLSEGRRGHVVMFNDYALDLHYLAKSTFQDFENTKIFLLGHGAGTIIALKYACTFDLPLAGMVLSSLSLGVKQKIPSLKLKVAHALHRLLPELSMRHGVDPATLSHDESEVKAYRADPLVHDRVSIGWYHEFLSAAEAIKEQAPEIEHPILVQVAGEDFVFDPEAAREFYERLGSQDKTLCHYEGLYHEIYNEQNTERAKVVGDLVGWLEERM